MDPPGDEQPKTKRRSGRLRFNARHSTSPCTRLRERRLARRKAENAAAGKSTPKEDPATTELRRVREERDAALAMVRTLQEQMAKLQQQQLRPESPVFEMNLLNPVVWFDPGAQNRGERPEYRAALRRSFLRVRTNVNVGGVATVAFVDSGASMCVIRADLWRRVMERAEHNYVVEPRRGAIRGFGGALTYPEGIVKIPTVVAGASYELEYWIVAEAVTRNELYIGDPIRDFAKLTLDRDETIIEPAGNVDRLRPRINRPVVRQ